MPPKEAPATGSFLSSISPSPDTTASSPPSPVNNYRLNCVLHSITELLTRTILPACALVTLHTMPFAQSCTLRSARNGTHRPFQDTVVGPIRIILLRKPKLDPGAHQTILAIHSRFFSHQTPPGSRSLSALTGTHIHSNTVNGFAF